MHALDSLIDTSNRRPRKTESCRAVLSAVADRRLAAYALAAGTAGVGVAALAQALSHQTIQYYSADMDIYAGGRVTMFPLDLNHDGVTDFNFYGGRSGYSLGTANISWYQGAVGWGNLPAGNGAINHPLAKGAEIGPSENFVGGQMMERNIWSFGRHHTKYGHSQCIGPFKSTENFYIGVAFEISGETHFGWIRVANQQCLGDGEVQGTITGYAYNTVANAPIQAGQIRSGKDTTSDVGVKKTLGVLALGAAGQK